MTITVEIFADAMYDHSTHYIIIALCCTCMHVHVHSLCSWKLNIWSVSVYNGHQQYFYTDDLHVGTRSNLY